ncbi:MAG TPA: acyl-CoA dehydrogenase family protein [Polyangia bacterium]|jgi:alkylation response protein AidB-like acyl-CoA dehydrogenase|nr:acyl-CoA dehydrogenase family protein [Polyangia bacterium]
MTNPAESPFVSIAKELGPGFAARAAGLDRSGEFVAENYRELKSRKLMSAGVPRELGGGGATHAELCEMIRELAHHCASTALSLSMHTHLLATAVWRHLHGQPAAPLLAKVAEGERVLVSTGASDWLDSNGVAERVDGGYRVTAQKRFASGSPAGDIVLTSAIHDDPTDGPTVLHFALPVDGKTVRVGSDWDTLGMRATGSHTLSIEGAFVPDAGISMRRPRGQWHPSYNVVVTVALPIVISAYVGLAESAAALAIENARKRPTDPHLPYQIGEMQNALVTAQMAWREVVAGARNYDFVPTLEDASSTLIRKTIAADSVQRCVKMAVEASGGGAFFRKNPLERHWRDVQAVHFHPLPELKQVWLTGRVAMGLPPV